jgi:hypothetical protein
MTLLQLDDSEETTSQFGRIIGAWFIAELDKSIPHFPDRAEAIVSDAVEACIAEQA